MADIADSAQAASDQLLDYGLGAHRRRQHLESARPVNGLGACHDCGEPIAAARLAADPRAARCIDCQQIHEHRARR